MEKFKNVMKSFAQDDSGAALVEYALILGVVVAVGGVVLVAIGGGVDTLVTAACTTVSSAVVATGAGAITC